MLSYNSLLSHCLGGHAHWCSVLTPRTVLGITPGWLRPLYVVLGIERWLVDLHTWSVSCPVRYLWHTNYFISHKLINLVNNLIKFRVNNYWVNGSQIVSVLFRFFI